MFLFNWSNSGKPQYKRCGQQTSSDSGANPELTGANRMQSAVLVLLLGVVLSGVGAEEDQTSPDLLSMVTTLQNQVESLQNQVQDLEKNQARTQSTTVAFFAGYRRNPEVSQDEFVGPYPMDTPIRYKNVVTNIGNGYNPGTGMFTAPVGGLYVFHFTAFNTGIIAPTTLAVPMKNFEPLPSTLAASTREGQDTSTRVAVLKLEVGETVHVDLPAHTSFYDGHGAQNSFSGFLVTPL